MAQGRSVLREWSGRATSRWVMASAHSHGNLVPRRISPVLRRTGLDSRGRLAGPPSPPILRPGPGLVPGRSGRSCRSEETSMSRMQHRQSSPGRKAAPARRSIAVDRGDAALDGLWHSVGSTRPFTVCEVGGRASPEHGGVSVAGHSVPETRRPPSRGWVREIKRQSSSFAPIPPVYQRCCVRPADVLHDRYRESGPV